jgi:uncharacterized MnhB-related membrane protein
MATLTWIYIGGAAVEASIVTIAFFGLRAYRAHFHRQHLVPFICIAIPWVVAAFLFLVFSSPVLSTFLLASVAGIYVPLIYWILKSPN